MMTPIISLQSVRALAATLFVAMHGLQAQQLPYDRTALIHGFGSRKEMWTTVRPELGFQSPQQYLTQRVDLGTVWLPSWDSVTVFDTEWQQLRDSIAIKPGG